MNFFFIIGVACAVWVILNVNKDQTKSNEAKLIWIVCAICFSVVTAAVYFFLEKKGKF